MPYERSVEIAVADGVAIRFGRSGRPIERYSVILVALLRGTWETVRVYDNHLGVHHMHRYTSGGEKQPAETFHPGTNNEAIAAAIEHLKTHWAAIIESWTS